MARGERKFRDDASGAPTKQSSYLLSCSCGGHLEEYLWPPPFSLALSMGGSVALNPWSAQGADINFFFRGVGLLDVGHDESEDMSSSSCCLRDNHPPNKKVDITRGLHISVKSD